MNPLETARELNASLEQNYLSLAVVLADIEEKELWKGEYESFADFYVRDLQREKSTVSRLLQCGRWLKENDMRLPANNVSYKRLASAIKQFPEKNAEYVLAVASTWKEEDFRADKKEDGHTHEYEQFCKHCWKKP